MPTWGSCRRPAVVRRKGIPESWRLAECSGATVHELHSSQMRVGAPTPPRPYRALASRQCERHPTEPQGRVALGVSPWLPPSLRALRAAVARVSAGLSWPLTALGMAPLSPQGSGGRGINIQGTS